MVKGRKNMKYKYDRDLRYHSDVFEKFGYANIDKFSKHFNIKQLNWDLNVCDYCGDIVNTYEEMYWQGSCADSWHECMGNKYEAVCDDCFDKLKKKESK